MTDDTNQYHNSLAENAADIIDEETDWVELAQELDVSRYQYGDSHPEWTTGTPFRPMFLSHLWTEVEDEPLGGLRTRLSDDPELAAAFGFDPADLPSPATFRPCRVEDRFETLEHTVTRGAEAIRDVAIERGSPLGVNSLSVVQTVLMRMTQSRRTERFSGSFGRKVVTYWMS
ncbi:hypothetical protein [Haloarcula laminariae]|uniref:hypothetical protein n=1 Tax=Haloarcula laminariae TaxID=2961577 RepID=UPI0021C94798|nr:hypothetical protein [Halomicroarcula laminariae]